MLLAFLQTYPKELVSVAVPIALWVLNNRLQPKARLVLGTSHFFTFLVQEPLRKEGGDVVSPTQTVNTASMQLINRGRVAATKLEIVFNWKPQHLNVWPARSFEERLAPDRRYSILFENLSPGELIGFELLAVNGALPDLITARSEQCVARTNLLLPQPIQPQWKAILVTSLLVVGSGATIYGVLIGASLLLR